MKLENINLLHLEDIKNPEHPSVYFEANEYSILILRFFEGEDKKIDVLSYGFILFDDSIYYYNKTNGIFEEQSYEKFYNFVDTVVDNGVGYLHKLTQHIEHLEDKIFENYDITEDWFEYKKLVNRIERILTQASKIKKTFLKSYYIKNLDEKLYTGFEDVEEHINRAHRNAGHTNNKLEHIYNLFNTLLNQKTNSVMYILTVISAIFLPLNLLVGFFGMNTEGLFFTGNPNGTIIVSSILTTILLLMSLLFVRKRWL